MSLPLQQRSYMTDSYTQALSSIYQYYDRVRDPSYALSQDVDFYEIMLRDPKVHQGVQDRLTSVAGPDWRVYPFNNSKDEQDVALAKLVDDAFRFIPHFADARMRMATAIFRGQSCELMTGKRKLMRLGMMRVAEPVWMFGEFKNIDPRRFTIRPRRIQMPDGRTKIETDLYMSTIPTWDHGPVAETDWVRTSNLSAYGYRKVDHPEWLIRVIYGNDEASLGYGRGLNTPIYFYHWIKQILLREGLQGVERWSQGIVVGTLDPDAPGQPDAQTTEAQRTAMLDALTKMRSRHVYVQGKHDDIEVITGGGEGHQMVMGMIDYIDDCIMAVCTGAVLMSGKANPGSAGSEARDRVGQDTQNKIVAADQKKIDEDISTWAIGMWVRQNWKLVCRLGLQNARMPQVKTVQPEQNNPDQFATRVGAVWSGNPKIPFRRDEFYEKLGMTPPDDAEDEVVMGADPGGAQAGMATDPSEMMMEGAAGAPQPAAAMRALLRQGHSDDHITRLDAKVDRLMDAIERLASRPAPAQAPAGAITMNSAPTNVVVEPPAPQPITMNIAASRQDDQQHQEVMAAHDRGAAATLALADKIARLADRPTPDQNVTVLPADVHVAAPVVNVAQPGIHVAAPNVDVRVAPSVNNFKVAAPNVDVTVDDKSAKPLGRIADLFEDFFGWFKKRKPASKTVDFKTGKDGVITGAKIEGK